MKKYRVKVNGKTFNVILESVEEITGSIELEAKNVVDENKNAVTDASDVKSPIQGTVLNVLVKKGQKVKKGDVLVIIEAMKLENEVSAPTNGEIIDIFVDKGQNVVSNQVLVKIK